MRRVVVTALGLITPLGAGVKTVWRRLIDGDSGIRGVRSCDVSDLPCKIAGEVPTGEGEAGRFVVDSVISPKDQRKTDPFIHFAMGAATEAVADSGWAPRDDAARERTGVMIGSGIGGLQKPYDNPVLLHPRGPRRGPPLFLPAPPEHHGARAFAHDEAVAVPVPRPRRPLRRVVEGGGQRPRRRETGDAQAADRRLGAAGDHHVGVVERDQPGGVADRVRARGAGGDDGGGRARGADT